MTSLGHSSLEPKESSGRNNFLTAGDIAAEAEEQSTDESPLTIVDDDSYQLYVGQPALEAPALIGEETTRELVKSKTKVRAPKPAKTPKPPRTRTSRSAVRLTLLAGIIGAAGLILSVILAVGALFIALDAAQGSAFFGHLSDLCNALVGPLKDVFTFSGSNADKKESLVGWGLGSMGYLLIGRFIQSVLQSKIPDN